MRNNWYQKWRQQKPTWLLVSGFVITLILYYSFVILTSNYAISEMQDSITADKKQIEWMTNAGQEILRLRQVIPHEKVRTHKAVFAMVNQAINDQGWNKLVSDVHQVDQNRVQINFKPIAFNDLIVWLQKLYDTGGVYVLEASLQKSQLGAVSAILVLQQETN